MSRLTRLAGTGVQPIRSGSILYLIVLLALSESSLSAQGAFFKDGRIGGRIGLMAAPDLSGLARVLIAWF